jgi:phage virion morphogenesis protein
VIKVDLEIAEAAETFRQLAARAGNLKPLMQEIGEILAETTKQRFQTSRAPDGTIWEPNAAATYQGYLSAFASSFKDGKLTRAGATRAIAKKPLIGESGRLSREIFYRAYDHGVEVGSALPYAAIHQFGGQAGPGKQVTIPARPYLGLSADDKAMVLDAAAAYLAGLDT